MGDGEYEVRHALKITSDMEKINQNEEESKY